MKLDKFFESMSEEDKISSAIRDLSRHQLAAVAKLLNIHVEYNDAVEDVETALSKNESANNR